jgi:hypothetical protein
MRSFLATAAILLCTVQAARADGCPTAPPVIEVNLPTAGVEVTRVRDVGAFAPFAAGASSEGGGGKWVINGLTKSAITMQFGIEAMKGSRCFGMTKIRITIGVGDPVKVLVADKYEPGTCQYNAILEHEMQHVDILRRGRILYAERFRQFAGIAASQGPFQDMAQAQERVGGMMDVVSDELKRALTVAHATIDTAESYLANQARCTGW